MFLFVILEEDISLVWAAVSQEAEELRRKHLS